MSGRASTLLKPTAASDTRRTAAVKSRAGARRPMQTSDLSKTAPIAGSKRARDENREDLAEMGNAAAAPPKRSSKSGGYGRVPQRVAAGAGAGAPAAVDGDADDDDAGSVGRAESVASLGADAPVLSLARAPAAASKATKPVVAKAVRAPARRAAATVPAAAPVAPPPVPADATLAVGGGAGAGAGAGVTSLPVAPVPSTGCGGIAADFDIEEGSHLVFKDRKWLEAALPAAKRAVASLRYGGTAEDFRRVLLREIMRRSALENYIKAHHSELASAASSAKHASTAKAIKASEVIASNLTLIMTLRKECAALRSSVERTSAEADALRAAAAAGGGGAGSGREEELERECVAMRGELAAAAASAASAAELRDAELAQVRAAASLEAEQARSVLMAAHEVEIAAAKARAREEARSELTEALSSAAAERAELQTSSEDVAAQLAAAHVQLASLQATQSRAHDSEAALRAELEERNGEIAELEAGLASAVREGEEAEARCTETAERLVSAEAATAQWQARWSNVEAKRASLLEEVLSLKGAIRVFARVRPPLPGELGCDEEAGIGAKSGKGAVGGKKGAGAGAGAGAAPTSSVEPLFRFPSASADDATDIEVVERPGLGVGGYGTAEEGRRTSFSLQRVLPPTASQGDVFAEVELLVQSALDGHRVSILAYGQTGSGKTWTMQGAGGCSEASGGIIPRAVSLIFERSARMREQGWGVALSVEILEIYNETVRDLLAARGGAGSASSLEIRTDAKTGAPYVDGLSRHTVKGGEDVDALLARAAGNRATGATAMNAHSSRSHLLFTLRISATHAATRQVRGGVLHLCDLAGSERIEKSGVNDADAGGSEKLLRETQAINKSLAALGDVVAALQAKARHIPYRNSKLTHVLQDALGAEAARTLVLCTLNPLHTHASESLSTLRFAERLASVVKAGGAGQKMMEAPRA